MQHRKREKFIKAETKTYSMESFQRFADNPLPTLLFGKGRNLKCCSRWLILGRLRPSLTSFAFDWKAKGASSRNHSPALCKIFPIIWIFPKSHPGFLYNTFTYWLCLVYKSWTIKSCSMLKKNRNNRFSCW